MIDSILNGRYRLDAEIGQGGMGIVYRAHDLLLDRDVAVKVLSKASLGEPGRARLLSEARSAARLNHVNIVSVYDAGEANGLPYIVMELIQGPTLFHERPQDLSDVIQIARQICAALAHAHSQGIIHRDLKPENVIVLRSQGQGDQARPRSQKPFSFIKLMDFGLARSATSRLSLEGGVTGTVLYLAPEVALGRQVDERSDLYALGVLLYELAAGRLPFNADDPLAVIAQHLHTPVTPPRLHRPELPPALEAIILKLLAKNPSDRYNSAHEVELALQSVLEPDASREPRPSPNNLPLQLSSFIGREHEIKEICRLLEEVRLVTLTGAGGSGKTRLALRAAGQAGEAFPDGVWLVELAALSDPDLVPQAVGSALRLREQPGRTTLETVQDYLRSRTVLLVLDNCEHLIEACAQLTEALLHSCRRLKILATSREAIGISGERAWVVPTLSTPLPNRTTVEGGQTDEEFLASLERFESVRLFLDRAAAVQPGFVLTTRNAEAVAQICSHLDGIPLAIELAAARLKTLTVEGVAARLDDRFNLLTLGNRTALPRHQTLRAAIDWSYGLLSETQRRLFYRLSVFPGGWTLEAAEAVWDEKDGIEPPNGKGDGDFEPVHALDLLTYLVDKSLATVEEDGEGMRYHMLETIRQYAHEKLLASGEVEEVQGRALDYYLALSVEAEPGLRSGQQLDWLHRLEKEHDNLRAILDWASNRGDRLKGLGLAGNLTRFWYLHGYWREGQEWLERLLAASEAETGDEVEVQRARARALAGLGWLSNENGSETDHYQRSLELAREIGDRWWAALALRALGVRAYNDGEKDRAAEFLDESLSIYRDLDDPWGMALATFNLGWLEFDLEDREKARGRWQESLDLFRVSGDRWGMAVSSGALGYVARIENNFIRSATLTKESLTLFRELGDKSGIADSLARLGNVAYRRDNFLQATELFEESLVLQKELGYTSDTAYSFSILALAACFRGIYQRANELARESLRLWQEIEYGWGVAWAHNVLGLIAFSSDDLQAAALHWEESLRRFRELNDQAGTGAALQGLGRLRVHQGELEPGIAQLEQSLELFRQAGDKLNIAAALCSLGWAQAKAGRLTLAAEQFRESLALRRDLGAKRGLAESLEGLAWVAARLGLAERAAQLYSAAEGLRQIASAPLPVVETSDHAEGVAQAQAALSPVSFAEAWQAGEALLQSGWEQVVQLGLEGAESN